MMLSRSCRFTALTAASFLASCAPPADESDPEAHTLVGPPPWVSPPGLSGNGPPGIVDGSPPGLVEEDPLGSPTNPAWSCAQILHQDPGALDGVYSIDPEGRGAFAAYCDMQTDGGGWTLVLKTDATSAAHYTDATVQAQDLLSPALDSVAKLGDTTIRSIQASGGTGGETRIESPALAAKVFVRGNGWSVPAYPGYPVEVEVKNAGALPYFPGKQCYDGDGVCSWDHYCFHQLNLLGHEHACVRRFATAGLWFNGGSFWPGSYQAGRVWIRAATGLGSRLQPATSCRAILAAGASLGDGTYWLDPDGSGAIPVHCDMTSDGGGWTLVLKTDASSAAHYTDAAVAVEALATPALDSVAKLSDDAIRALQLEGGVGAETRIETPSFTASLFVRGNPWSVPTYTDYPIEIEIKNEATLPYLAGEQCYDEDCGGTPDHYCFHQLDLLGHEHACVRRFATAGLWFNGGSFSPGSYQPGRIWVR